MIVLIAIFCAVCSIILVLIQLDTHELNETNKKILAILQGLNNPDEIQEDIDEIQAELHKLESNSDEESEEELSTDIRNAMNNSNSIWEEDALSAEEIETL